jgi:hypothetical protein
VCSKGFGFMSDDGVAQKATNYEPFTTSREESHSGSAGVRGYYLPAVVKLLDVHSAVSDHRKTGVRH